MNLRLDLILPEEQRSASVFNLRMLTRIATFTVPVILAVLVALVVLGMMALTNKVRSIEAAWAAAEPKKARALKLIQHAKSNDLILREIEGWQKSRLDLRDQLVVLQEGVDPRLQISSLRISQAFKLVDEKFPARAFVLDLSGRASGTGADAAVQALQQHLLQSSVTSLLLQTNGIRITRFTADPQNKNDRLFDMDGVYAPRRF